jgi:hypothetical protein
MEHANPWIGLGDRVEPVGRSVGRPVIGKDDFSRLRQPIECLGQYAIERRQSFFLIIDRNDDRDIHRRALSKGWYTRACRQISQIVAAARWSAARKFRAVLS